MSTNTERSPWETPADRAAQMADLNEQVVSSGPADDLMARRELAIKRIKANLAGGGSREGTSRPTRRDTLVLLDSEREKEGTPNVTDTTPRYNLICATWRSASSWKSAVSKV